MRKKSFKLRSLTTSPHGKSTFVDLPLQFEGKRAFVIWSSAPVGGLEFTARVEINPKLLQRLSNTRGCDYFYCGLLELPRPENN